MSIAVFYNMTFNYVDDTKIPVRTMTVHTGESIRGISRGRCLKHSQINADTYRDYKTSQVLAPKDMSVQIDPRGNYRGLTQMKELRLALLKEALQTDASGRTKIETLFEEQRLKHQQTMCNLDPEYDETIDEEKSRIYLYLGDDFGIVKLWDLTYVLS